MTDSEHWSTRISRAMVDDQMRFVRDMATADREMCERMGWQPIATEDNTTDAETTDDDDAGSEPD